jgi:hypothetical protein
VKVLVCGSREFTDRERIREVLATLPATVEIIHGGARGADRIAASVASELGLKVLPPFLADWERFGKRAGYLRNYEMLDERPEVVIAFWDGESRGTQHTIAEAVSRRIPVKVIGP